MEMRSERKIEEREKKGRGACPINKKSFPCPASPPLVVVCRDVPDIRLAGYPAIF